MRLQAQGGKMGKKRVIVGLVVGLVVISGLVFGILSLTRNVGKTDRAISTETAQQRMEQMLREIEPQTAEPIKSSVEYTQKEVTAEELPALDTNEVTVPATTDSFAEIWASPEKAGQEAPALGVFLLVGKGVHLALHQQVASVQTEFFDVQAIPPDGQGPLAGGQEDGGLVKALHAGYPGDGEPAAVFQMQAVRGGFMIRHKKSLLFLLL
jgi:hypothetical protein